MRIIGITGGVGAGKSAILAYIESHYNARVILADQVANDLKLPGMSCYEPLIELLGTEIVAEDKTIDKARMAQIIFNDQDKLLKVNELIHPAVKSYIIEQIRQEKARREIDFLFIEAALLIEDHYDEIVDELWYIYADEDTRRRRLKESRGYPDAKIDAIIKGQLAEQVFREKCHFVIDNSKELAYAYEQIAHKMEDETWK